MALKSESKLTKINNHVHRLSANTKSISHEEVLAIKNAFMKALSANGVDMAEINEIRKELGLAPDETAPKALAGRSLKPLSRQQIRDIIDRNTSSTATPPPSTPRAPSAGRRRSRRRRSSTGPTRQRCTTLSNSAARRATPSAAP